jgi:[ribosomal protein S5]-alanine N-acetyltransferase
MVNLDLGIARIRSWREDDAASVAKHANDRNVWRNMRDRFPHPYAPADARAFIAAAREREPETFFAIDAAGAAVGGIGYTLHDDVERIAAEVGYWLGAEYWGRGIMSAAIAAFTRYVFERHRELRRLYAVPFAWNPASARILEKAGYQLEGRMRESAIKDGAVVDQLLYAILRGERPD